MANPGVSPCLIVRTTVSSETPNESEPYKARSIVVLWLSPDVLHLGSCEMFFLLATGNTFQIIEHILALTHDCNILEGFCRKICSKENRAKGI